MQKVIAANTFRQVEPGHHPLSFSGGLKYG